jgi:hypothetical protein
MGIASSNSSDTRGQSFDKGLTFIRMDCPDEMLVRDKTEHGTVGVACQIDDIFQEFNQDLENNENRVIRNRTWRLYFRHSKSFIRCEFCD